MVFKGNAGELVVGVRVDTTGMRTQLNSATKHLQTKTAQMSTSVNRLQGSFVKLGVAIKSALGFGAILAIGHALKAMGSFEAAMLKVKVLTKATDTQFKQLSDTAKEMGRSTIFSASQAADALGFLARAGFTAEQAMGSIGATMDLAAASGQDLATTADQMSNIMQSFGLSAEESGHASDVLAAAAANSNTNITQLAEGLKYAAPIAKALGLSLEETVGIMGKLGNAGIQSSMAGTTMRQALISLITASEGTEEALNNLGITVDQVATGQLSLIDIMKIASTANISATDALDLFGARGQGLVNVMDQGIDKLAEFVDMLQNSHGEAARQAAVTTQGLIGAWTELKSATEGLIIAIGESGVGSALTGTIKLFTKIVRVITEVREVMTAVQKITVKFIKIALAPLWAALKPLRDMFASLTEWIKKSWAALKEWLGLVSGTAFDKTTEKIKTAAEKANALTKELGTLASKAKDIKFNISLEGVTSFKDAMKSILKQVLEQSLSHGLNIVFGTGGGGGGLLGLAMGYLGIKDKVSGAIGTAKDVGGSLAGGDLSGAASKLKAATGVDLTGLAKGAEEVGEKFKGLMEKAQAFADKIQEVIDFISGMIQSYKEIFSGSVPEEVKTKAKVDSEFVKSTRENVLSDKSLQQLRSMLENLDKINLAAPNLRSAIDAAIRSKLGAPEAAEALKQGATESGDKLKQGGESAKQALQQGAQSANQGGQSLQSSGITAGASLESSGEGAGKSILDAGSGFGGILQNILGGIGGALGGGGGGGGGFGGIFSSVIGGLFGGGGGGGGGGGFGSFFGGLFADGGVPPIGRASIVGEEGPELFVPHTRGTVIPNGQGMGGGVTIVNNNNFTGMDSVNQATLAVALEDNRRRTISDIENMATRGGSFTRALRG